MQKETVVDVVEDEDRSGDAPRRAASQPAEGRLKCSREKSQFRVNTTTVSPISKNDEYIHKKAVIDIASSVKALRAGPQYLNGKS